MSKTKKIMRWIEKYQSGKGGIYPYQVTMLVCAEFNISIKQSSEFVIQHIKDVIENCRLKKGGGK